MRDHMSLVKVLSEQNLPAHLRSLVDALALELHGPVVTLLHRRGCLSQLTLVHVVGLLHVDPHVALSEQGVRMVVVDVQLKREIVLGDDVLLGITNSPLVAVIWKRRAWQNIVSLTDSELQLLLVLIWLTGVYSTERQCP